MSESIRKWITSIKDRLSSGKKTEITHVEEEQSRYKETVELALSPHRERLALVNRTLFDRFDKVVAEKIGFDGSIREEIFARRPLHHSDLVNTVNMNPRLAAYVNNPSGFFFRETDPRTHGPAIMYGIEVYGGTFDPKIHVATDDGGSIEITALTGRTRQEYHCIRIQRFYSGDGKFIGERMLTTFSPGIYPGDPEIPLKISQRLANQKTISIHYTNPDEQGNVEIQDGQWIMVLGGNEVDGIYSATNKMINWQSNSHRPTPSVTFGDNQLTINIGRDQDYTFPLQTNMYKEIRQMMSGSDILIIPNRPNNMLLE